MAIVQLGRSVDIAVFDPAVVALNQIKRRITGNGERLQEFHPFQQQILATFKIGSRRTRIDTAILKAGVYDVFKPKGV